MGGFFISGSFRTEIPKIYAMKKILLLIVLFSTGLFTHAQEGKIYSSLDKALKNPSEVFILSLNNQKLKDIPESITRVNQSYNH